MVKRDIGGVAVLLGILDGIPSMRLVSYHLIHIIA